jgi:acetolactate synthase I/III small subunit
MRHLIAILLQNEAGALTRVTGLISTRGYNIESLSVAPTKDSTVSRITLVTTGSDAVIAQINAQLLKLVDVVAVEDMTSGDHLARELLLIKLQIPASTSRRSMRCCGASAARCCRRIRRAISWN